jgi:hypothetical protein
MWTYVRHGVCLLGLRARRVLCRVGRPRSRRFGLSRSSVYDFYTRERRHIILQTFPRLWASLEMTLMNKTSGVFDCLCRTCRRVRQVLMEQLIWFVYLLVVAGSDSRVGQGVRPIVCSFFTLTCYIHLFGPLPCSRGWACIYMFLDSYVPNMFFRRKQSGHVTFQV